MPFPAPNRASRVEDIEAAAWNRKVANILATGSGNGFTSIWDLKQSREILHLRNPNRERVSSLAWDPDNPTRIITGCGDDTSSVLYVWDLRNSHAPAQVALYDSLRWLISDARRPFSRSFIRKLVRSRSRPPPLLRQR